MVMTKGLFGKNGAVPLSDSLCCEKQAFVRFEMEGEGLFGWGTGQNRCLNYPLGDNKTQVQRSVNFLIGVWNFLHVPT